VGENANNKENKLVLYNSAFKILDQIPAKKMRA